MLHTIQLTTDGQTLSCNSVKIASGLLDEIECEFTLDSNWDDFTYLRAIFSDKFGNSYAQTLTDNKCNVPQEVMLHRGYVTCNLCAYNVSGEVKSLQMTSYMTKICDIEQEVHITGDNSSAPTTETWEQELSAHTSNSNIHTTASEKATWNAKLDDAASDSKTYGRKNGAWVQITGGGGGSVTSVNGQIGDVVLDYEDVGALSDETVIPSKTSELTNDSGFLTSHQSLANYYNKTETDALLDDKQDSISDLATIRSGASLGATSEQSSNKVTSVSSSSTDTQYPTAKCLYDMCGNIESLLASLL